MNKLKLLVASLLAVSTVASSALTPPADSKEARIKKAVEAALPNAKVDSITKTPYGGLYEVTVDRDVLYTDETGKYMFFGNVIDSATKQNYTKERTDELTKIKFSDLPLEQSVKMVNGKGKRVIAVFEDPNCGYCKRFRHELQQVDNITVYTFMYNILAPTSAEISRNVWCSPDKARAWEDWMTQGKHPAAASASCQAPNDQVLALGNKLKITGTPTIFFTDGTRIPGMVDAKALEEKLASVR